ncbi:hypothetical protein RJI07_04210 [Mycoplasmatota bacterium WC30]
MDKISFKKALKFDGYMRSAFVTFIVTVIVGIIMLVSRPDENTYLIFAGLAIASIIVFTLRYYLLTLRVIDCREVEGTIIKAFYYRGAKAITYTYIVDGVTYKGRGFINMTNSSRDLKADVKVDLLVKNSNPKKSLIGEFYVEKGIQ